MFIIGYYYLDISHKAATEAGIIPRAKSGHSTDVLKAASVSYFIKLHVTQGEREYTVCVVAGVEILLDETEVELVCLTFQDADIDLLFRKDIHNVL